MCQINKSCALEFELIKASDILWDLKEGLNGFFVCLFFTSCTSNLPSRPRGSVHKHNPASHRFRHGSIPKQVSLVLKFMKEIKLLPCRELITCFYAKRTNMQAVTRLNTSRNIRKSPLRGLPFTSGNCTTCFPHVFKEGQKLRTINSERDDDEMML